MDDRTTEASLSLTKFGVGQPVRRSEDPKLVRGEGSYTDDVSRPGQAYAVMVRSREPHGVIRSIDTAAAKAMPGVLAIYTASDLTAYGPLKCGLPLKSRDGSPIRYTPRPALAADKVRFVGDPVACVVAETVAQAKDAAEAVTIDIEPLPVVLKPADAVKPGAPLVFDAVPNNVALDYHFGDAAKVAEAFAKAKHVTRLETSNQRMVVNAMEPRSAIGEYDAGGQQMDALFIEPGRARHEDHSDGGAGYACRQGARGDRPGRRLVRDEGGGLSGIHLHPARRASAGASGEMDRRAFRQLRVGSSWPRAGHGDRDGVR